MLNGSNLIRVQNGADVTLINYNRDQHARAVQVGLALESDNCRRNYECLNRTLHMAVGQSHRITNASTPGF